MGRRYYTVAVDFDGVIHSYTTPWVNARTIPDPPVPGAIDWLFHTIQDFDIAVTSTRNHQFLGAWAMRRWLKRHARSDWYKSPGCRGLEEITFPRHKPAALIYIGDRALRFDGSNWPSRQTIHTLLPWHREAAK